MNNRERYKEVFNKIESPGYKSMDEIMAKKQRNFRASRRLVSVLCLVGVLLVGTVTVNAATGGLVGDYFSNLLGGDEAIAVITWGDDSECRIEVNMEESSVGIYDENNTLVDNITSEEAGSIAFASDDQSCTFNGSRYKVILVCGVNKETGECQNQVRLYDPADFNKAQKQFNADQVFKDDKLTVYCPNIDIE